MRDTLDLLGKIFQFRTCDGTEPGRASGSPCLDYFIKRCGAPCVGYVTKEEYRESIDSIVSFLSGRYRHIERDLERKMNEASRAQEFEQAALFRNRLKYVRTCSSASGSRTRRSGRSTRSPSRSTATDANAQVFQVRDGVLADRQSFYLENPGERGEGEVAEEFVVQYYATSPAIPPQVIVPAAMQNTEVLAAALGERRGTHVEVRHAERGDKRRIFELAERNARLALDQDRLRSEHRRAQRIDALEQLQDVLGMETIPMRIECFDISHVMGQHNVASMVVFEGGRAEEVRLPPLRDQGVGPGRLRGDERGADAADGAVRRPARAVAARARLRRVVRLGARADRDRRRQGPAAVGARGARAVHATSA